MDRWDIVLSVALEASGLEPGPAWAWAGLGERGGSGGSTVLELCHLFLVGLLLGLVSDRLQLG